MTTVNGRPEPYIRDESGEIAGVRAYYIAEMHFNKRYETEFSIALYDVPELSHWKIPNNGKIITNSEVLQVKKGDTLRLVGLKLLVDPNPKLLQESIT